jgi:SAM-dependent methyltransferase
MKDAMNKINALQSADAVQKPDYGNWVSKKFIVVPGILGLVFLGLALINLWMIVFALIFLAISGYFIYAWRNFALGIGNIQGKVWDLLLARLNWDGNGKALDIGCGNAPVTIKLAQKHPQAQVTGIDYWGGQWDYSKSICEQNAEIEGVKERVIFQKASASALPFEDGYFDAAVSNLVFHEVFDIKDKKELIREALRVVKKGGRFAFQDLFLEEKIYGNVDDLLNEIRSWGVARLEFIKTCDEPFIPRALKLPFMIGKIGIFYGEK